MYAIADNKCACPTPHTLTKSHTHLSQTVYPPHTKVLLVRWIFTHTYSWLLVLSWWSTVNLIIRLSMYRLS